jgi:hypothetical protein
MGTLVTLLGLMILHGTLQATTGHFENMQLGTVWITSNSKKSGTHTLEWDVSACLLTGEAKHH